MIDSAFQPVPGFFGSLAEFIFIFLTLLSGSGSKLLLGLNAVSRNIRMQPLDLIEERVEFFFKFKISGLFFAVRELYYKIGHGAEKTFARESARAHGYALVYALHLFPADIVPAADIPASYI